MCLSSSVRYPQSLVSDSRRPYSPADANRVMAGRKRPTAHPAKNVSRRLSSNPHKAGVTLGGEHPVGETLAYDSRQHALKTSPVPHVSVVEPKRLFVQIPLQVERGHGNVGATDCPLEERPEILKPVRVNAGRNVFGEVIDAGIAFRTSGCPGKFREDVSACDRPYGDSPPSNIASYPFQPNKTDIRKIRRQLRVVEQKP